MPPLGRVGRENKHGGMAPAKSRGRTSKAAPLNERRKGEYCCMQQLVVVLAPGKKSLYTHKLDDGYRF